MRIPLVVRGVDLAHREVHPARSRQLEGAFARHDARGGQVEQGEADADQGDVIELRYVDLKAGRRLQVTAYDDTQAHVSNHEDVATVVQLVAANGTTPYTFSMGTSTWGATGLPPGLTLTPSTGRISGTPTTAASYDGTRWWLQNECAWPHSPRYP